MLSKRNLISKQLFVIYFFHIFIGTTTLRSSTNELSRVIFHETIHKFKPFYKPSRDELYAYGAQYWLYKQTNIKEFLFPYKNEYDFKWFLKEQFNIDDLQIEELKNKIPVLFLLINPNFLSIRSIPIIGVLTALWCFLYFSFGVIIDSLFPTAPPLKKYVPGDKIGIFNESTAKKNELIGKILLSIHFLLIGYFLSLYTRKKEWLISLIIAFYLSVTSGIEYLELKKNIWENFVNIIQLPWLYALIGGLIVDIKRKYLKK